MQYAYIRVSRPEQNIERQIDSIKQYCPNLKDDNIFVEKKSGKNINDRIKYQEMKALLQSSDELIIHELDRLGRNKEDLKNELEYFRQNKIKLRILEIPTTLVQMNEGFEWVEEMINNILIEVYSTIAQKERENITRRVKEGLASAKSRGRVGGRPVTSPEVLEHAYSLYKSDKFSVAKVATMTGISTYTIYGYIKTKVVDLHSNGYTPEEINKITNYNINSIMDIVKFDVD